MYSLLQKKPKVITDPYPHVIIEEALPWDLYEELEKTFPEKQVLNTIPFDNDICYRLKADILVNPKFQPDVWRKFAEYHTSAEWMREVYELFKPWLSVYPNLTHSLPNLEENVSARGWAGFNLKGKKATIETDCQLVMHKPITEKTTRTPHIDNPLEMFACFLYMPYKDDTSTGGEFQLHTIKNDIKRVNKARGREVYPEDVGPVHTTVPYKRNTFVIFCNATPNTVHSVSKRVNPSIYRRSINIIAQFKRAWSKKLTLKMWHCEEIKD
jgi:hypothetical protein